MPKKSNILQKRIGIFFLYAYFTFIMIGTMHYHRFDLNTKDEISSQVNDNFYSDLNSDFFSVCSLHQFAQTIDDFHYSSSDIIQSLSKIETNLSQIKLKLQPPDYYSKSSPRAPPFSIS